ncbi:MAG: malonyl-CoA decarboxylase [Pseudomonadales bacterium]|nr:malonyl-CoA decarboxylase [Pseudomonadales bacterium]
MITQYPILNRTFRRLRQVWADLNSTLQGNEQCRFESSLSDRDLDRLRQLIINCLAAPGGEFARRAQAAHIGHAYMSLDQQGRKRFLQLLASDFDADDRVIKQAIDNYLAKVGSDEEAKWRYKLSRALVAPRVQLLTLFNAMPQGIKFLVDMRSELLVLTAGKREPELSEVEKDLKHLLTSWFDIGFLQLQQLTWQSPAAFLEKLIEYEAVHEITSWVDLKNRMAPDRRLFAFVHPNMEDEPLIFVQVALCEGLAGNVQTLLDTHTRVPDMGNVDTAIFYSISNAQKGLSGISFGNFLIKRVVAELKRELPQLKRFATLSPVPGFMAWLQTQVDHGDSLLLPQEKQAVEALATAHTIEGGLKGILAVPAWHQDREVCQALQPILLRLCAEYLCQLQPNKLRVLDGVAHFHLGNGATLQQIHWMANVSPKGMRQSAGIMVNYLYDPRTIDANSESYVQSGAIAFSNEIREQLRREKTGKAFIRDAG